MKLSFDIEKSKPANEVNLSEESKVDMHEVKKGKKEGEKQKAPPRIRFPDSPLFQNWGKDLAEDQQIAAQELFEKYGYNVYLSDRLPLTRSLKDTRPSR